MRITEVIKPIKPLTAAQQRIKSLQTQKQNISNQLQAERQRQQRARAQEKLRTAQAAVAKVAV
jgi:hypothetical protein